MLEVIALDGGFIELRGRFGKTTSGMENIAHVPEYQLSPGTSSANLDYLSIRSERTWRRQAASQGRPTMSRFCAAFRSLLLPSASTHWSFNSFRRRIKRRGRRECSKIPSQ